MPVASHRARRRRNGRRCSASDPARTVLLVDFDGSLVADRRTPRRRASPLPAAVAVLARARRRASGGVGDRERPPGRLPRATQLPVPGLALAGSVRHGARRSTASVAVDPRVAAVPRRGRRGGRRSRRAAARRRSSSARPAISVTLHWRHGAGARPTRSLAVAAELAARHGLAAAARRRMAVELRPPVADRQGHRGRRAHRRLRGRRVRGRRHRRPPRVRRARHAPSPTGALARAVRIGVRVARGAARAARPRSTRSSTDPPGSSRCSRPSRARARPYAQRACATRSASHVAGVRAAASVAQPRRARRPARRAASRARRRARPPSARCRTDAPGAPPSCSSSYAPASRREAQHAVAPVDERALPSRRG